MKQIILLLILFIISGLCITAYAWHFKNAFSKNNSDKKNPTEITEYKNGDNLDFEILPTMDSPSKAKNQVWVGTFQLVWNDLTDEIIKGPVEFSDYDSKIADSLNEKSFEADDISETAYYKKWGLASPALKKEIETGILKKFNEKSEILNTLNWIPAENKYILYAMLKKDFEFIEKLAKLGKGSFNGSDGNVEYFGIGNGSSAKQRLSIEVLFYNNHSNYAVALKSKQGDVIKLYRTNDNKTLSEHYNDMNRATGEYIGHLGNKDQFKAPMMDFKSIREFDELCNKQIKNSDLIISQALETIQFKMNEAGVKLKSEAAISVEYGCLPKVRIQPRYFYFDDKFVMFISEEGKKPYFAMKVTDAKQLQQN